MKVRRTWLDVRELVDRSFGRGYADLAQLSKVWRRERYRVAIRKTASGLSKVWTARGR